METLIEYWPIITTLFTLAAGLGVALYKIREHDRFIKSIKDVEKIVSRKLFYDSGESRYMPRTACEQCRVDCHNQLLEKFADVKVLIAQQSQSTADLIAARFDTIERLLKPSNN